MVVGLMDIRECNEDVLVKHRNLYISYNWKGSQELCLKLFTTWRVYIV